MSKQAICPECNKPCGPYRPGAKVYHMACLEAKFKALREEWEKETSEEKTKRMDKNSRLRPENVRDLTTLTIRAPGETRNLLMTCPRCKRLVFELDETYCCPWCVSLEEEC